MDWLVNFITENAHLAHWVVFAALMGAGLNLPVSEDLLLILSGVLASTVVPENTWKLFAAVFFGAYLSDWVVYWLGRLLGPRLWQLRWFRRIVKPDRLEKIENYYSRYGVVTLLVGRFIPFGVRNCLFMSAGMGKMHFGKFLIGDGIACLCSNSLLFWTAYALGKNYDRLSGYKFFIDMALIGAFAVAIIGVVIYKKSKNKAAGLND